jgi:hypothetical protein
MSCRGKGYGKDVKSDDYLYAQFISSSSSPFNNGINRLKNKRTSNCLTAKNGYPSFTPYIGSLSTNTSVAEVYTSVSITGNNFLPFNSTYVNFGAYKNIPVIFYSPNLISFVVPASAIPGNYNVKVVNIYNNSFNPSINMIGPGSLVYSNSLNYTIQ